MSRFGGAEKWSRPVLRYRSGAYREEEDVIATEFALTLYVNDAEFATLVCTPTYAEDLVYGFLASEGVIRGVEDVESLAVSLWTERPASGPSRARCCRRRCTTNGTSDPAAGRGGRASTSRATRSRPARSPIL